MSAVRDHAVVITGLGLISSIGNSSSAVLESLINLRSGVETMQWLAVNKSGISVAGTIKDFDVSGKTWAQWKYPDNYRIRRDAMRGMAPHGVYAVCAALQAINDASLTEEDLSNEFTGLHCASAGSPFLMRQHLNQLYEFGAQRGSPMGIVSTISGTLNFNLGAYFRIKGSNLGFVSACASSSHALAYACEEIRSGRQLRMLVIGAEDLNAESILPFAAMRVLSLNSSSSASRPFDSHRDGFVGTGGAAALILESADLARQRGVHAYAQLQGWGQASDGFSIAGSHEEGEGLARAMTRALKDAALAHEEIQYINAHATSTQVGDVSEAKAIARVFGTHNTPWVSSTKAITGHALSMAGALESAICCLAIKHGFIPGQAHLENVDPQCAHLRLPTRSLHVAPKHIMSNSSGFGGSNVSLIFSSP
ncbi:MAG: beta-ketoacyl-[acyl-carrier-protein] synthase family protein [Verrucomicrobia bacterium]|nr:beta-ketoacyl-[acyl-carrier-protein] synthase family protein [Verrucomicrobiota bacterium]